MKKISLKLVILLSVFLIMAGCQQKTEVSKDLNAVPHSNGPTTPPSVKGPVSAPPHDQSKDPQAVTETEDVRYTLPSSTN